MSVSKAGNNDTTQPCKLAKKRNLLPDSVCEEKSFTKLKAEKHSPEAHGDSQF